MCGVFGIRAPERDVARVTYFGLFALQHRGQESAGIAVSDHGRLTVLRDMGLVTQVFDEQKLRGLHGDVAIGHTRYSTTGSTHWANAQPLIQRGRGRTVALGHNGNLVNAAALRDELAAEGVTLGDDLRHRADRRADRERRGAARGRGRRRDGAARRRLLGGRALGGDADRLPRPARLPPALPRPRRARRVDPRLRDLRARPRRRRARARARAGRAGADRRGRRCTRARPSSPPSTARSASSSSSTSPGPTRGSTASRCTARACGWASGSRRRRRSRPTSCCRSPTPARRRRSASRARPGSRSPRA